MVVDGRIEKISSAGFKGPQSKAALFINSNHHNRDIDRGWQFPKAPNEVSAIHLGHFIVGDDEIGRLMGKPIQSLLRIAKCVHRHILFDGRGQSGKNIPVRNPVVEDNDERHERARCNL